MKRSSIGSLNAETLKNQLSGLNDFECSELYRQWSLWARAGQMPPPSDWRVWLILAGRGFGKTRTGAEWVRAQIKQGAEHVGLIAPTAADARDIMVDGESGILSVCWAGDTDDRGDHLGRPKYQASRRRVVWENGATAMLFSAEEPDRLRGPQHDRIWADEMAAWRHIRDTWDMAMFGLRIGDTPRACVTTTPKPLPLIRELMDDPATALQRGSTFDNAHNLALSFLEGMKAKYQNTTLGRQELEAEIIEQRKGALWNREKFEALRVNEAPALRRIIVAIDPPATAKATSDACGIIVAECDERGHAYVLADRSINAAAPSVWAGRAVGEFHAWKADTILAEVNQGGDMVKSVLQTIDPDVPVISVRASRGKYLRAEPVAALYEGNRVHHVGALPELEDEMCDFTVDGLSSHRSPDRLDACVWAVNEMLLKRRAEPRIHIFN